MARITRDDAKVVREIDLIHSAAERLRAGGWQVEEEPLFGHMRPDLLAMSPENDRVFVIEMKLAHAPSVHFGALAQLDRSREAVETSRERPVTAILVTNASMHEQVQRIADGLGIRVFSAAPEKLAKALFDGLQELGG